MYNTNCIAICGLKRSGKDTIANYICNEYKYTHYKIATPLKNIIKELFHLSTDDLETSLKDELNPTYYVSPRTLMDFIGTHVFQYEIQKIISNIGRNFWINHLLNQINIDYGKLYGNAPNKYYNFIISDLRFNHELEELSKTHKTFIIKVINDKCKNDNYVSEMECMNLKHDYIIYNNNSIEDLYKDIANMFLQKHINYN